MFRFVSDWKVYQRVINIDMLVKSMKNPEISTLIIDAIARCYSIHFHRVAGFSYDRAAPNLAAMRALVPIFPMAENLPCVSHTLCHCGERFTAPNLSTMLVQWRGLFAHTKCAVSKW